MALAISAFLTEGGIQVIHKLLATKGPLHFTRAQLGNGVVATEEEARAMTALISPITDTSMVEGTFAGGQALITTQYSNTGLLKGFFVNEIGLFVRDPDDDAKEILYCYATFGSTPDWIAPQSAALYVRTYRISTIVSDLQNITVQITPGAMISKADLVAAVTAIDQQFAEVDGTLSTHFNEFTPEVITTTLANTLNFPFSDAVKTLPLTTVRNSTNYSVEVEVLSGFLNVGDIYITDKMRNGFKIHYTGSSRAVDFRLLVRGGIIT